MGWRGDSHTEDWLIVNQMDRDSGAGVVLSLTGRPQDRGQGTGWETDQETVLGRAEAGVQGQGDSPSFFAMSGTLVNDSQVDLLGWGGT